MKQVIIVRQDLNLPKGKMAAQCAHAAVDAEIKSPRKKVEEWLNEGMKKIVLKVKDLAELKKLERLARAEKLVVSVIVDAGLTTVEPGTVTCMGIGPDEETKIDKITGKLKMV
ncbi:MAG: peptidyl-tRNA hydrolase Pth2 [Nanoarchaeota archaeon]